MANRLLAVCALLASGLATPSALDAQTGRIEIVPNVGWQWGGGADVVVGAQPGEIRLKAAPVYGVALDFEVRRNASVQLAYSYQPSELTLETPSQPKTRLFDVGVHFLQVGGVAELPRGRVTPYGIASLGATNFDPRGEGSEGTGSEWRFSGVAGLGAKVMLNPRVGIRAQGAMNFIFLDTGSGIFCGVGGCSLGLAGSGMLQGVVQGGVVIAL